MSTDQYIPVHEYSYDLPAERIARYPLKSRDQSRLLIYSGGNIRQALFRQLPSLLPESSSLFFNNTRVIHARLKFRRKTGAVIEVFCLSPEDPSDYQVSFSATGGCTWKCLVGNLKKWKGDVLELPFTKKNISGILRATKLKQDTAGVLINFAWNIPMSFGEIIETAGIIPIPPYLNRESETTDNIRYQTVYSRYDGSVAAPTAGLHFTKDVLKELRTRKIDLNEITLHVGAGTFQPVKTSNAFKHIMHGEFFSIPTDVLEKLTMLKEPLVITGTTTLRALESLFWLAFKSIRQKRVITELDQWEYTQLDCKLSPQEVFGEFVHLIRKAGISVFSAHTRIMIVPGYEFRMADALITNYHQPQSTLLLLVAAFIGEDWRKVYEYALKNDFRFLSYGDSSLLWRK